MEKTLDTYGTWKNRPYFHKIKKRFVIVDGSNFVHRAHHALPKTKGWKDKDDVFHQNGAIVGVMNMLTSVKNKLRPDLCCCVFDASRVSFRTELYKGYKANRPPTCPELKYQIPFIHEAAKKLGWSVIVREGVEGDDVIGSLVAKAQNFDMETVICSGDKDLAQLVNDNVFIFDSMSNKIRDTEGVMGEFGIPPEKITDYLMLVGDTADNIPGVNKVGPKTATSLLVKYGSIEGILANVGDIRGIIGSNIRLSIGLFELTRKLVTIKRDVGDLPDIETLTLKQPDYKELDAFYKTVGYGVGLDNWWLN